MSVLRNALDFLGEFGIFDVVLPFLLVFAVVFGILEKTKILGEEKIGDTTYPRKNLDGIVAFAIAMLVVAATKVVGVLSDALPKVSLLIIASLSFLLMIGIFMNPEGTLYKNLEGTWMFVIMIFMFISVILIFLSAIPANANQSWLGFVYNYVIEFWSGTVVSSLILLGIMVWAIFFITKGGDKKDKD